MKKVHTKLMGSKSTYFQNVVDNSILPPVKVTAYNNILASDLWLICVRSIKRNIRVKLKKLFS